MKKYIIELDPLVKNRLQGADTELLSNDLEKLINALDALEEFDEKDYLECISKEKLEEEIQKRKDAEISRIKNRLWCLGQEKSKISNEIDELDKNLEELQSKDS